MLLLICTLRRKAGVITPADFSHLSMSLETGSFKIDTNNKTLTYFHALHPAFILKY
jgi:hypothetical protein